MAPDTRKLASHRSTHPMIWMAPRPSTTGTNRLMTLRTDALAVSRLSWTVPSRRRTGPIWMPNWAMPPTSTPHDIATARLRCCEADS